jgi:glycine betaine/proline transport system ATP-binding protein
VVFITHDLNEAMHIGDRIAVMRDGRIVQIGTAEEILNDPDNDYVAQFVADVDRTRVLTAASVMEPAKSVVVSTAGPRAAIRVMRENQTGAAFVADKDRTLRGIVLDRDVLAAANRGEQTLDAVLVTDIGAVDETTLLAELFAPAAESSLPVAVKDAQGRLAGVVPRVTLLAAMASMSTSGNGEGELARVDAEAAS